MKLALFLGSCGMSLWLPVAMAQDKLPALAFIPNNLSGEQRAQFTHQRDALEKQLSVFQAAAKTFNDKTAENQSDAEYNTVQAQRTEYISAAKAFNEALAAAEATAETRAALPAAKAFVRGHGEFHFVTKDGLKLSGANGTMLPLDGGTSVITGPDSHLTMLLPDGTTFTLGPNSDILLDDFVFDSNTSVGKVVAQVIKGTFRFVTGKIASRDPDNMKVKLAVGILGPRGTDVEAKVSPDGSGYVKVFSGQVEITEKKNGELLLVNAGQMVTFNADGSFSASTPLK